MTRLAVVALAGALLAGCGVFGTESGNPSSGASRVVSPGPGGGAGMSGFGNPGTTPSGSPGNGTAMPAAGTGASSAGSGGSGGTPALPCVPSDAGAVVAASCVLDAGLDQDAGDDDDAGAETLADTDAQ